MSRALGFKPSNFSVFGRQQKWKCFQKIFAFLPSWLFPPLFRWFSLWFHCVLSSIPEPHLSFLLHLAHIHFRDQRSSFIHALLSSILLTSPPCLPSSVVASRREHELRIRYKSPWNLASTPSTVQRLYTTHITRFLCNPKLWNALQLESGSAAIHSSQYQKTGSVIMVWKLDV